MMMIRHRPTLGRRPASLDQFADVVDLDGEALGGDDIDVGMGAVEGGAALAAGAAASLWALERRSEGPSRIGSSRAGRTGEEPGVGHLAGVGNSPSQGGDDGLLTDDVLPDRPLGGSRWRGGGGVGRCVSPGRHAISPSWRQRRMTSAWITSGSTVPSTTR